jgi:two-component system sensor histidine kinase AlgZ
VIITWGFLLPLVAVEDLRARAEAVERSLLEQRAAALKAQIEAIQSRTNPHFLFNAINTIASLIHDDPKLAEATLERLADILRYALESARLTSVPLARELQMLRDYLEVQQARFGARLQFDLCIEPGLEHLPIAPLLLQPLVENAVLHGVAGSARGGSVLINARKSGGRIEIRIEDNGPGPGASTHRGSGTSLLDLRRRIELLYGDLAELSTTSNRQGGYTALLSVPTTEAP